MGGIGRAVKWRAALAEDVYARQEELLREEIYFCLRGPLNGAPGELYR